MNVLIRSMVLVVLISGCAWLAKWQGPSFDISDAKVMSANPYILSLLDAFDDELSLTLVNMPMDARLKRQLQQWQSHQPKLSLHSVSMLTPEQEAQYRLYQSGVIIEHRNHFSIIDVSTSTLDDAAWIKALTQVYRGPQRMVVTQGHGEPLLNDHGPKGLSRLVQVLEQQGLKPLSLDLANINIIPEGVSLIVVLSPDTPISRSAQVALIEYVNRGGRLLWFFESIEKAPILSAHFGIQCHPGVIVDQKAVQMGVPHPAITMIFEYPTPGPFASIQKPSAYPFSCALDLDANHYEPILITHDRTWTHVGSMDQKEIAFSPERAEVAGPLVLAAKRKQGPGEIMVVSNQRFITNGVISNHANAMVGLSLMNEAMGLSPLTKVEYPTPKDVAFDLDRAHLAMVAIMIGLMLGLTALFLFVRSRSFFINTNHLRKP